MYKSNTRLLTNKGYHLMYIFFSTMFLNLFNLLLYFIELFRWFLSTYSCILVSGSGKIYLPK